MPFFNWLDNINQNNNNNKQYPTYLTPKLITLIQEYESGKAQQPIHRRVTLQEYQLILRYWNSNTKQPRSYPVEAPKEIQALELDDQCTNLCQFMPKPIMQFGNSPQRNKPCPNYKYWL